MIGRLFSIFLLAVSAAVGSPKPHIILMMADDIGYGDVGILNPDSKIKTPNLDTLGKSGIRFTDAHSNSSVCTPTRYGVLTGEYCFRTRLKKGVLGHFDYSLIGENQMTIGTLLQDQGYYTAVVGKWHVGLGLSGEVDFHKPIPFGPNQVGFDYAFYGAGTPGYHFVKKPTTLKWKESSLPIENDEVQWQYFENWDQKKVGPMLTEKAVAVIDEHGAERADQPLFMYIPFSAVHTPIAPAVEFEGSSETGTYGDFVAQLDWSVGEVVDALKRNKMIDNTLIFFTSDNGPELSRNNQMNKNGHQSAGPYRGAKRDLWEGGHRVPFLASWPGMIEPNTTSDELVCSTDFLATFAALLGCSLPEDAGEDSYNILPAMLKEAVDGPLRKALVHHTGTNKYAIRKGKWKLILAKGSGGNGYKIGPNAIESDDPPGQLYNLQLDPYETNNLYTKNPETVSELSDLLDKYIADGRSVALPRKN